jgi:hypothetical protein
VKEQRELRGEHWVQVKVGGWGSTTMVKAGAVTEPPSLVAVTPEKV